MSRSLHATTKMPSLITTKDCRLGTLLFSSLIVLLACQVNICTGHGRMIEPPSRSSAWRYGFQTPPNYNDHELYCGGFQRQWQRNNGQCGVCGDAFDAPRPHDNEYGGKYGLGVIVRKYNPGTEILIRIELTASHMGHFEFRVCPDKAGTQDCLDKYLLEIVGGNPSKPAPGDLSTRFYPRDGSRIYEIRAKLPPGLECGNCLVQWIYVAGNNWGKCDDGTEKVGCGPQEQFRACSDVTIGHGMASPPLRPMRPSITKPTKASIITKVPVTQPEDYDEESDEISENSSRFVGLLIAFFTLLFVVCCMVILYFYHYHGDRIKSLLQWRRNGKSSDSTTNSTTTLHCDSNYSMNLNLSAPVPPPRNKRLSSTLPEIHPTDSNVLSGMEKGQLK